jgi:hypothetical protein
MSFAKTVLDKAKSSPKNTNPTSASGPMVHKIKSENAKVLDHAKNTQTDLKILLNQTQQTMNQDSKDVRNANKKTFGQVNTNLDNLEKVTDSNLNQAMNNVKHIDTKYEANNIPSLSSQQLKQAENRVKDSIHELEKAERQSEQAHRLELQMILKDFKNVTTDKKLETLLQKEILLQKQPIIMFIYMVQKQQIIMDLLQEYLKLIL